MDTRFIVALAAASIMWSGGCEKKEEPAKTVGGMVDKAKSAASDAGKAASDAGKAAGDAAKHAVESAQAGVTKWISETVEKQWPQAKAAFEEASKKVSGLSGDSKTKAEGLVKDLQAQIPTIEEAVNKLKTSSGADLSKMWDDTKKAFDGWMGKLGELKTLVGTK